MGRYVVIASLVVALAACKKESASGEIASATKDRPAKVTDTQVKAAEKAAVESEALGKELTAAAGDCVKATSAITAHAAAIKTAGDEIAASKIDKTDDAVTAYFKATYASRLAVASAALATSAANCATNEAYAAAARAFAESNAAFDEMGVALDEAMKALDEASKEVDKAAKEVDKANKELENVGKEIDKAFK